MKSADNTSLAQALKRTQVEEFDLVILGDSTGSTIAAAQTFAGQGKRVAIIERKYIRVILPEHRAPVKQKHHQHYEGRFLLSPRRGVWHHSRPPSPATERDNQSQVNIRRTIDL